MSFSATTKKKKYIYLKLIILASRFPSPVVSTVSSIPRPIVISLMVSRWASRRGRGVWHCVAAAWVAEAVGGRWSLMMVVFRLMLVVVGGT